MDLFIPAEAGIHKRGLSEESKYLDEIGFELIKEAQSLSHHPVYHIVFYNL
jgi:hypothetical protein